MFYLALSFDEIMEDRFMSAIAVVVLIVAIVFVTFIMGSLTEFCEKLSEKKEKRTQLAAKYKMESRREELLEEYRTKHFCPKQELLNSITHKEYEIKECERQTYGLSDKAARLRRENTLSMLEKELESLYSKLRSLNAKP